MAINISQKTTSTSKKAINAKMPMTAVYSYKNVCLDGLSLCMRWVRCDKHRTILNFDWNKQTYQECCCKKGNLHTISLDIIEITSWHIYSDVGHVGHRGGGNHIACWILIQVQTLIMIGLRLDWNVKIGWMKKWCTCMREIFPAS